jgi:molybdenum cofactor biosynthesis enzyme
VRFDVEKVDEPYNRLLVPRTVDPSLNVTIPVSVEVTVAVKVTGALSSDGLELDMTTAVVAARLTIWVMPGEVDVP